MVRGDIRIEISYDLVEPENSQIKTNAKKEKISDILKNWALTQIGQGEDMDKVKEVDAYRIVIELDLSRDTFYTTSNTGNAGLTAGIIMDIMERLNKVEIVDL